MSIGLSEGFTGALLTSAFRPNSNPKRSLGWVKSFPVLKDPSPVLKFKYAILPFHPSQNGSEPTVM